MAKSDLCERCSHAKIEHDGGKEKCTVGGCSCRMYVNIIDTIRSRIPAEAEISRIEHEPGRIALYSKNPKFLQENNYIVSDIVNMAKRRVVVRTDK